MLALSIRLHPPALRRRAAVALNDDGMLLNLRGQSQGEDADLLVRPAGRDAVAPPLDDRTGRAGEADRAGRATLPVSCAKKAPNLKYGASTAIVSADYAAPTSTRTYFTSVSPFSLSICPTLPLYFWALKKS